MRDMIRRWLGITELEQQIGFIRSIVVSIDRRLSGMTTTVGTHNHGLAMIIAKLNPLFHIPEDDPRRKADSDKIGDEVIKKLEAEFKAQRQHQGGE